MKALCVAAHADDPALWMGGAIRRLNEWTWHVLSLCTSGYDRERTFYDSCRDLSVTTCDAKQLLSEQFSDGKEEPDPARITDMKNAIMAFADAEYDLVFTHSGYEYGFHANHVEARDAVNELIAEDLLKTKGILYFCYTVGGAEGTPVKPDLAKAHYKVVLSDEEQRQKGMFKRSFDSWARPDLANLGLLDNNHPETEAFLAGKLDIQLPPDFVRLPRA